VVGTVLALCVAFVAPAAVLGTILALPRWYEAATEARRRRLRDSGRLAVVPGQPLERLAADLRRLRQQRADPGRSRTQREGARLAYEDVIRETAEALEIPHDLHRTSAGLAREVELLRVEQALLDAGLVLAGR
jgi:hypothetical protein